MHREMIPYLQKIISLEQAAYVEESTLRQLQMRRKNTDTKKHQVPVPIKAAPSRTAVFEAPLIVLYLGLPAAGVIFFIFLFFLSKDIAESFRAAIIALLIVAICIILLCVWVDHSTNVEHEEEYKLQMQQKSSDVQREEQRYQQAVQLVPYLDQLIVESERKLTDTRELLQKAYDKGLLYGKYRNFVAVCSICEYLESGRCSELSGPDGAYNLFEMEIRMNLVITQLNSIISKLDQIQANQAMLYDAISAGNQLTSQLIDQTNECIRLGQYNARQNAITAYYSQQTAQEVSFSNWLQVLQA